MRSSPRPRRLAAALTTAFGSSLAFVGTASAQATAPADTPATLPTISVKGKAGDDAGPVAQRGTTGTKTDTPLVQVPQSISVITRQEIEDKGFNTLTEALAQTPGVSVSPFGFDSRVLDWVVLRGFDGYYTSSYRDGLAQNVGLTFLSVQTEVYGLERLEVLRGPSSVLFGKGDVGGVVNRVSKLPSADAVREVAVQVGSYDHKQIAVDVGGALDPAGQWLYRLVGVGLDTGTQEEYPNGDRMTQKRVYLAPSLRWQPTAQTSVTLQAEHLRDNGSDDVQFVTGANGQPTNVKEGDPNYSVLKTGADAIGYQIEHQLGNGWSVQQKLRYAHRTSDKHHILSSLDADGVTLERLARHDVESVNEAAVDTNVQGTLQTGPLSHRLLFGVDWDHTAAEWRRTQDMTTPLNMNAPVYGIDIAEPTTLSANTLVTSTQLGVYAQDQIRIGPHWGLTAGLRHDRAKADTDDRFNAATASQTDNATTGRIGIDYQIGNGWAPYASYGESFVPNVGVDVAGNAFVPSRGKQVELGLKYMPEGTPLTFTAAVFNLEKTNVVGYDPQTFEPRQIGKVRSQGLELEAKAQLSRQLNMTASFTALNMKVLTSVDPTEVGNMPILVPKQTASVWLDYALAQRGLPGISVAGGLRYSGKRFNDVANSSSEPAYTLADAALRYETGPWRFALNVTNLFNKRYYSGQAYGSYFRGADRNVLLTAKYRF